MSNLNSRELLELYQAGQGEAATALFERYVQRLLTLARSRIGAKLKRRLDPEDVVQSAYRSFFLHADKHEFELVHSGDLWRLLANITLNKLYGQLEKHSAAKRTVHREVANDSSFAEVATTDPTAAEVVALTEQLALALKVLSSDERFVITSTLQGQTTGKIARLMGKSQRTVRRLLANAKVRFEQRLLASGSASFIVRSPIREPHAPLRYADYDLEQLIGAGGMGKVYRATEKTSGRTVAVKALHKSRQSDERAIIQFVQEANVLAKLRHPNIVGVQGLGRFPAGGYFIVMDFVEGKDLQSQLHKRTLPVTDAVAIIQQIAAAVHYAHGQGIVHCDLKPGNVIVGQDGKATVSDFGFAHMMAHTSQFHARSIGGTVGYIAPEVLLGGRAPTPAADIYGLGAMLWALRTGRPPEIAIRPHTDEAPRSIADICARCLAADPEQRYQSVADFIEDLSKC